MEIPGVLPEKEKKFLSLRNKQNLQTDYNLLLSRLESKFAIRGKALQWFKSYLSQRSQFVRIDLDKSLSHELNCGVPQGSVLGPVLYLLYTSPVADILRCHNMDFHLYADDTQLYTCFFLLR